MMSHLYFANSLRRFVLYFLHSGESARRKNFPIRIGILALLMDMGLIGIMMNSCVIPLLEACFDAITRLNFHWERRCNCVILNAYAIIIELND